MRIILLCLIILIVVCITFFGTRLLLLRKARDETKIDDVDDVHKLMPNDDILATMRPARKTESETNSRVNTLWTIEEESQVRYDTGKSDKVFFNNDSLLVFNCEVLQMGLSDFLHEYTATNSMICVSGMYEFSTNANVTSSMHEVRTIHEFIGNSRSRFKPSGKNHVSYYCSWDGADEAVCNTTSHDGGKSSKYPDIVMIVVRYMRLCDSRIFYQAHIRQVSGTMPVNYFNLVRAFNTLRMRHNDWPLVITCNYGQPINYALVTHYWPESAYHVSNTNDMPTRVHLNESDGFVIDKRLYDRVEYWTDFKKTPGDSDSLVMHADMYIQHEQPGCFVAKNWPLLHYSQTLKLNTEPKTLVPHLKYIEIDDVLCYNQEESMLMSMRTPVQLPAPSAPLRRFSSISSILPPYEDDNTGGTTTPSTSSPKINVIVTDDDTDDNDDGPRTLYPKLIKHRLMNVFRRSKTPE